MYQTIIYFHSPQYRYVHVCWLKKQYNVNNTLNNSSFRDWLSFTFNELCHQTCSGNISIPASHTMSLLLSHGTLGRLKTMHPAAAPL